MKGLPPTPPTSESVFCAKELDGFHIKQMNTITELLKKPSVKAARYYDELAQEKYTLN